MSRSRAGESWASVHPSLVNLGAGCPAFEASNPRAAGEKADVVFLALPHGRSQELLQEIEGGDPKLVVDTAADFRINDPRVAEATYGPHKRPDALARFSCGLADVEGLDLAGAGRVAVPGCFATASMLALWTVAEALGPDSDPVCFAVTGSSGSGTEPSPRPTIRGEPTISTPTLSGVTGTKPSSTSACSPGEAKPLRPAAY